MLKRFVILFVIFFSSMCAPASAKELRVLTTFLPMYVFTRNVADGVPGIRVETLLSPALGCPHDYQLRPGDVKKIAAARALIANGGIEAFLGDALKRVNPKLEVFVSNAGIKLIRENGGERGYNPHTWVGPTEAMRQVDNITRFLSKLDPANKAKYAANAARYKKDLAAVRDDMRAAVKLFPSNRVVTFHDAFDYLARDIGLRVAGYVEATPGQEPSAGEMMALVKKIRDAGVKVVFAEPQYPARAAETVARETKATVSSLDPMSQTDLKNPPLDLYQKVMRKNLHTLKKTMGKK